jgi:hypothetical protein
MALETVGKNDVERKKPKRRVHSRISTINRMRALVNTQPARSIALVHFSNV